MTYPENLSLVELTQYYKMYQSDILLEELKRRDELSENCTVDFYKKLVSEEKTTDNVGTKADPCKEAFKAGFRAGLREGKKANETG